MTDKQIMINGVEFYRQTDINRGLDEEHYVVEFHLLATHYNLLLENYASKTQECEELKSARDNWISKCEQETKIKEFYQDGLSRLKTEKEQIKKYLGISSKTIMERLGELQEFRDKDRDKLYHAEQKLEKIKEIAEWHTTNANSEDIQNDMKQILQLISECEVE